jgi:hypothetical protein
LQPLLDVVERVHVGNIVDDADAVSAAVVRRGDGTETLLASSVPLWMAWLVCVMFYWESRGGVSCAETTYDL